MAQKLQARNAKLTFLRVDDDSILFLQTFKNNVKVLLVFLGVPASNQKIVNVKSSPRNTSSMKRWIV